MKTKKSQALREAALKSCKDRLEHLEKAPSHHCGKRQRQRAIELERVKIEALRPITREQVEMVRGEWIDIDGEKVPVDKYGQPFGWAKCSACGEYLTASDEYPCIGHFCPNCGAPMTDKAVDMVMERLEALHSETKTD